MQDLIATKLGIQRITGITVFDTREKKSYNPSPDLEVGQLYFCYFKDSLELECMLLLQKAILA